MKNFRLVFLVLGLVAMLSGCGSTNGEAAQQTTELTHPVATEAAATESETAAFAGNSSDTVHFTNKFGTPQTICAHAGCDSTIASSGDTNCCTKHSATCLNCGKYIDEDATYCMDCLTKSTTKSSGRSSAKKSSSKTSSGNKCHYKEGNTEVCSNTCAPGSNFCSYHKKLLEDIYSNLTGK